MSSLPSKPAKPARRHQAAWSFIYATLSLCLVGASLGIVLNGDRMDQALLDNQRTIEISSRIATYGEEISKSVLLIERAVRDNAPMAEESFELQRTADRLDQLVNAFNESGETVGPDGSRFRLSSITDPQALALLQEINTIWFGIKGHPDRIIRLLSQKKALPADLLRESSSFVVAQQRRLETQSIAFGKRLQETQKDQSKAYYALQVSLYSVAVLSGIALPALVLLNRLRRTRDEARAIAAALEKSSASLEQQSVALSLAKTETDRIMDTVQEGLLLIDAEGRIGSQFSSELRTILRVDAPAGQSLAPILQRLLTEKMYSTTKDYLALLFDARRKEKTILKVNPLEQVEVHFSNPAGGFTTRHLGFAFRRIMKGDTVERVFITIRDITAQVELELGLREAEKRKERQLEILLNIIHVDAPALEGFTSLLSTELTAINDCLKAEDFANASGDRAETLRQRLKKIFASVHNLKGNAALLGLDYFVRSYSDFESSLTDLLNRPSLTGDDFIALVVRQSALREDLAEISGLAGKLREFRPASSVPVPSVPAQVSQSPIAQLRTQVQFQSQTAHPAVQETPSSQLLSFIQRTAASLGKQVSCTIDDTALLALGAHRQALLRDILVQLARNSLAHGIETPAERTKAGKDPVAKIQIQAASSPDGLPGFSFKDDGRGLDLAKIRSLAVQRGLVSAADADALEGDQLAAFIFEPGFSTAEQTDDLAGRGMGMDIIRSKVIDEAGGDILLSSEPGRFLDISLFLPTPARVA